MAITPAAAAVARGATVDTVRATACEVPRDALGPRRLAREEPTTVVIVEVRCAGERGVGYAYADASAAEFVRTRLAGLIEGRDPLATTGALAEMVRAIRFMSRPEVSFRAISAVDIALWDLKARLLGLPLCDLLGPVRERVPVYGSSDSRWSSAGALAEQLGTWAAEGMASVKIRVIGEPCGDRERVRMAREAIGDDVDLFVDAAGTHRTPRAALAQAEAYSQHGVACLEQPLATDDVDGLARVREGAPAGMAIAARSDRLEDLRHLLDAGAVDVVQVDATRCLGVTGFLAAGELCRTHDRPLSARRAPAVHLHLACAVGAVVSLEWFQEHARVERLLFEGAVEPYDGIVRPDFDRPGLGLDPRPDALAHWQI